MTDRDLLQQIDKLRLRVQELEAAQQWQPIGTAPKDGTRIMLWRGPAKIGEWAEMVIAEWVDRSWRWPAGSCVSTHAEWEIDEVLDGFEDDKHFTHWMPLPKAPKL